MFFDYLQENSTTFIFCMLMFFPIAMGFYFSQKAFKKIGSDTNRSRNISEQKNKPKGIDNNSDNPNNIGSNIAD